MTTNEKILAKALLDAESCCMACEGVGLSYWSATCGEDEAAINDALKLAQALLDAEAP